MSKKKLNLLLILGILFFSVFAIAQTEEFDVSEVRCSSTETSCNIISDKLEGDCRFLEFETNKGALILQSCKKGDVTEIYRHIAPKDLKFEACIDNVCVTDSIGFNTISRNTNKKYPILPSDSYKSKTYIELIEEWNNQTWEDTVSDSFSNGLAAVRWYESEGECSGLKCENQLHNGNGACPELDIESNKFCGVTDEFSNVLLNYAMGLNLQNYEKLHRFSEKLRSPEINNLQCWQYYVSGNKDYQDYNDLCVKSDSASDASIRILGAYAISCAKQKAGIWKSEIDFCADYEEQGNAIWGLGTNSHGEIKYIPEENRYYLCNGYNNQEGCPEAPQSIRPDYYELQFLMDFAFYKDSIDLKKGVIDILDSYQSSLGSNGIHDGKTGLFDNSKISNYECVDLCESSYMDNTDTWRAIPAISGLYTEYAKDIPLQQKEIFSTWWNEYGGGNPLFGPSSDKPFEIYSSSSNGKIKSLENSYKTTAMWIPLGVSFDEVYTKEAVAHLIEQYNFQSGEFNGAAYYGAYYSQFAQRAIGSATGMISPYFWNKETVQEIYLSKKTVNKIVEESYLSSCDVSVGECTLIKNEIDGCRTNVFLTDRGEIKVLVCEKENSWYEIYLQEFPKDIGFKVCWANGCVSNNSGFARFQLTNEPNPVLSLENSKVRCSSTETSCNIISDKLEGDCRFLEFETNKGTLVLQSCKKGDVTEIYRHIAPKDLKFEACIDNVCVTDSIGFNYK
jgi:hypothetical protein